MKKSWAYWFFLNEILSVLGLNSGYTVNIPLCLQEFLGLRPQELLQAKGYLTIYPSSCPNTDTVKCSAKWLLLCSATQCILINCDEDDFGVSVTFRTSQEIQCLPYEGIFFRDLFHETTYLLLKNKYGDLLNLSYIHIYFIC